MRNKKQASSPAQGRGGSFISDSASRPNFMTDVQANKPDGARFDLSKETKLTFDMGYLVPIIVGETLPKSDFRVTPELFARFQALVSPAMDRFDITMEYFYCPYRLLWDGWEQSIMSVHNGNLTPPAMPYFQNMPVNIGTPADYFGLPLSVEDTDLIDKINPFAFSMYNFVYNEFYRNPAIDPELPYKLVDGLNSFSDFNTLLKKRWNSDYFTRALPSAQAGNPVEVGLLKDVDVNIKAPDQWRFNPNWRQYDGGAWPGGMNQPVGGINSGAFPFPQAEVSLNNESAVYDPADTLVARTSQAGSITVSDLRLAYRLQEWAERAMRFVGGSKGRYKDFMKGFFNSNIKDATLQRPLYLGGSVQPMTINGVTQTSESSTTPLGELAGQGIAIGAGGGR